MAARVRPLLLRPAVAARGPHRRSSHGPGAPLDSSLLTVRPATGAKLKPKPPTEGLQFGHHFSDHMLTARWSAGPGWSPPAIEPLGPLSLHPASKVLHYAQEVYEGMKAFRGADSVVRLFRPSLNMHRMNTSAARACLPTVPPSELLACIQALVTIDQSWVPAAPCSLYIRPCLLGTEGTLGLGPSSQALLTVILSPVGSYYSGQAARPVALLADPRHVRSFPGGCGDTKMGSNYAPTLRIQQEAQAQGCDQVLWTHGRRMEISEVGSMNIFLLLREPTGPVLVTPSLASGTVLPGITRQSVLELAAARPGLIVQERTVTLPEVLEAQAAGRLVEMFGTGTAAAISQVGRLRYAGADYPVPAPADGLASSLLARLQAICYGREPSDWAPALPQADTQTARELGQVATGA